jgi:Fe-S-cluster containining protein
MTCNDCGKCCRMDAHKPFITARDVQKWIDDGKWKIINQLCFTVGGTKEKPVQEWTFKEKDGYCVFHGVGKCRIYSSRPLVCQAYPSNTEVCEGKQMIPRASKHVLRSHNAAIKNWNQASQEWRQEKLMELITHARGRT